MKRPIVRLTDFGLHDAYVGQLKAVIASIAPGAPVIDLMHDVEPYAIDEGAWCLETSLPVLPEDAVVCAIVDPGVGTARKGLVVASGGRHFVGPDNGLLSAAFEPAQREQAAESGSPVPAGTITVHELRSPQYALPMPSSTFHGRDIFAPAAAHLANHVDDRLFGPPLGEVVAFPPFAGRPGTMGELNGYIVHVDRYGNLVTTIRAAELFPHFELVVGGVTIVNRVRTFANVPEGQILCHADSSGFIAIAVHRGDASAVTGIRRGDPVLVRCC